MPELQLIKEFNAAPELVGKIYNHSLKKEYKPGETVLAEHTNIRSIPIVTKGSLKVIRTEEDGREILLYYIKTGESCIMSLLGGLHNDTSKVKAEVEEDSEILFLPIEKAVLLIKEYPEWLEYIFKLYHKRFEELLEIINDIAFKKIDERILDLLNKKNE